MRYDGMLSNKSSEKGGQGGEGHGYGIFLLKQPLRVMRPCFLGSGWTSAWPWEIMDEYLFLLCLRTQLLFYL